MYTLTSFPIIGSDVAKVHHGRQVANLLLALMTTDERHILGLAEQHTPEMAVRAASYAAAEPNSVSSPENILDAALGAPLGGIPQLRHLVRHELLGMASRSPNGPSVHEGTMDAATDVVMDALAPRWLPEGTFCDELLDISKAGLFAVLDSRGLHNVMRPETVPVAAIFDQVARMGEADLITVGENDSVGVWAEAMHQATWALFTRGQLEDALANHLHMDREMRKRNVNPQYVSRLWNLFSGAITARMTSDLLDAEITGRLTFGVSLRPA